VVTLFLATLVPSVALSHGPREMAVE